MLATSSTTAASSRPQAVWGKRIWERQLDAEREIVVDERGVPTRDAKGHVFLDSPTYCWKLRKRREVDGLVLHKVDGYNPFSGAHSEPASIDVLYADLIDGDLVTVFNQRGKCWAYQVHRRADGYIETRPTRYFSADFKPRPAPVPRPPQNAKGIVDNSVGPPMKSAEITKQPDGMLLLRVTDDQDLSYRYQLRSWETKFEGRSAQVYYWDPLPSDIQQ